MFVVNNHSLSRWTTFTTRISQFVLVTRDVTQAPDLMYWCTYTSRRMTTSSSATHSLLAYAPQIPITLCAVLHSLLPGQPLSSFDVGKIAVNINISFPLPLDAVYSKRHAGDSPQGESKIQSESRCYL